MSKKEQIHISLGVVLVAWGLISVLGGGIYILAIDAAKNVVPSILATDDQWVKLLGTHSYEILLEGFMFLSLGALFFIRAEERAAAQKNAFVDFLERR